MKKLFVIAVVIFAASCSSKDDNPGNAEEIKQQISEYKNQVVELNKKIAQLEEELKSFDEENISMVPVNVEKINYQEFNHYVQVNGNVEAVHDAFISPEINGQVQEVFVKEGQRVKKGALLMKINSSVTESSIEEVKTSLELAKTVYKKQKQLWEKNIGSEIEYLEAKNNMESLESRLKTLQAQLEMAIIRAPINGIVDEIQVKEGELAIPGMQVVQMVNLSELYVNADVADSYLTKVEKGDKVLLEFPSFPDYKEEVPVHRVGNTIKTANRTFTVQLKIDNPGEKIKPNIIAVVKINDYSNDKAIVIPSIIVKEDLIGPYVYVVGENNGRQIANKRYIETGLSYQDKTMVTNGLSAEDKVIVKGYNQVSDGVDIKISRI